MVKRREKHNKNSEKGEKHKPAAEEAVELSTQPRTVFGVREKVVALSVLVLFRRTDSSILNPVAGKVYLTDFKSAKMGLGADV